MYRRYVKAKIFIRVQTTYKRTFESMLAATARINGLGVSQSLAGISKRAR